MKKNILKLLISIAPAFLCLTISYSFEGLKNISIAEIKDINVPLPEKASVIEEDDTIGIDATARIPFTTIKKLFLQANLEPLISLIDPSAQILSKSGENIQVKNIRLDINGIIAEPVFLLKPYIESRNLISIKIEKVKFHILMRPNKSLKSSEPQFNIEDMMEKAMDALIKEIMANINQKLKEKGISSKAEEILNMKYYKNEWILKTKISTDFIKNFINPGLLGNLSLKSFSYDDKAFYLNIKTDK